MTTTEPNPVVPLDRDHPLLESIGVHPLPADRRVAGVFAEQGLPWENPVKILSGNAARVYNIDVPQD